MSTRRTFTSVLLLLSLFIGSASPALAATSTDQLIIQLQAQIATLTAKLAELTAAQNAVVSAQKDAAQTLALLSDLKEGSTGDDVSLLQSILAGDSSIYPEGMITGYYGPKTRIAVIKFQEKHGIRGTGYTGELTKKKLNEILRESGIARERNSDDNDNEDDDRDGNKKNEKKMKSSNKFCIPPGHLTSPGWRKHFGDNYRGNWIPLCNDRWAKPISGSTTPPILDTTAPLLSAVSVSNVTHNAVKISWMASEQTRDRVYLATSSPVATGSPIFTRTTLLSGMRDVSLSGLLPNTTYRFILRSDDVSGNAAYSTEGAFTTLTTPDGTAPILSEVMASGSGSGMANVTWTTNEAATSKVYYAATTPLAIGTSPSVTNSSLVTNHSTQLSGLSTSTTYYVIVSATDASGNTALGTEISFVTGS